MTKEEENEKRSKVKESAWDALLRSVERATIPELISIMDMVRRENEEQG